MQTAEDAETYGGVEGVAYDPFYHQACDSLDPVADGAGADTYAAINAAYPGKLIGNLNTQALDEMSDAVAHGTLTFAQSSSDVNGTEKGKATGQSDALYQGSRLQR